MTRLADLNSITQTEIFWISIALTFLSFSCVSPNGIQTTSSTTSSSSSTQTSLSLPGGARAAKFLFVQSSSGSFDAAPAGGTVNSPGSGLQAKRVYNPDGSLLASGTTSSSWPTWISSFEIGITGSLNTAATNSDCARFSTSAESTATNCKYAAVAQKCSVAQDIFRVSEADCSLSVPPASAGNGGPNDGIYLRATFNRSTSILGPTENILVVLEYAASALNPAPSNPTSCFTAGLFSPESCSDFTWKAFLKHSASEIVSPFLLLVPPAFASVLVAGNASSLNAGSGVAAKQFFLPLAADSGLSVLQISRIQSNFSGTSLTNLQAYCTAGGGGIIPSGSGNSPLCAGMVFYSITFYRI